MTIGRFVFSKESFDKAIMVIHNSINKEGWLIIDEIGPIELRGEGLSNVVREVLASVNEKKKILLVVRERLVDKVKDYFQLDKAIVINNVSAIA